MLVFKIIVGAAILFLLYKEFGGPLKDLFNKAKQDINISMAKNALKANDKPKDVEPEKQEGITVYVEPELSLSVIVGKWEELRKMCRKYNLDDAEKKLDEVFPLLLDDKDSE